MKRLLILLFALQASLAFAGGPLKLVSATVRHWVSGAPGGRQGDTQNITLRICKGGVVFEKLWLGNREVEFQIENGKPAETTNKSGDTINLSHTCAVGEADCAGKENTLPKNYKGAALLQYKANGVTRYLIIKQFARVEDSRGY